MIVISDTIGRNYDWLPNSEPALEITKAKGAQAAAAAAQLKTKTRVVRSAAQQAKPIMVDQAFQEAARAVAGSVGRQLGNRLIDGVPGGYYDGR